MIVPPLGSGLVVMCLMHPIPSFSLSRAISFFRLSQMLARWLQRSFLLIHPLSVAGSQNGTLQLVIDWYWFKTWGKKITSYPNNCNNGNTVTTVATVATVTMVKMATVVRAVTSVTAVRAVRTVSAVTTVTNVFHFQNAFSNVLVLRQQGSHSVSNGTGRI